MTRQQRDQAWREIESAVNAAGWLMKWADCNGPLDSLPTSDPAVQAILSARRHLLRKANRLRKAALAS